MNTRRQLWPDFVLASWPYRSGQSFIIKTKTLLPLAFLVAGIFLLSGCGKKSAPKPNANVEQINNTESTPAPANVSGPVARVTPVSVTESVDVSAQLSRMTQVLRRYGVEHRRVPQSLNELVTAGYLTGLPAAPAGKKFAIDATQMQVILQ